MEPRPETVGAKIEMAQFVFSLVGMTVGVVIFTYSTFVTKEEVTAKSKADEKIMELMRQDLQEVKQDVKILLKNSKD